ncbi:hypothetical protein K438DRAFT_1953006 [Mycena galopus ATCC 62051]|nr:hypothetical protein K438DRAFT_1953006 [Mycena galopus ATCC 62051]
MGALDLAFGTGLIGSWLASLLCGVGYSQAFQYYKNFPQDHFIKKSLVAANVLFSFVALVGAYADVYEATITFWGNPAGLLTETWSVIPSNFPEAPAHLVSVQVPMYSCANAMAALTVNSYLISRFYAISKNLSATLALCVVTLFAFIMAFLVVFLYPGVSADNFQKVKKLSLTWAIACVISDVCIAISLVFTLRRMTTSFQSTNRLIRRIIIVSIQNGCATSLAAIAGMIAVIFKIDSNLPTLFFFLLSPLYLLTLLSNFNLHESGKSGSRAWSSSRNTSKNTPSASIVIEPKRESLPRLLSLH